MPGARRGLFSIMLGIILCLPFNDHDEDDDERDLGEGMFENIFK